MTAQILDLTAKLEDRQDAELREQSEALYRCLDRHPTAEMHAAVAAGLRALTRKRGISMENLVERARLWYPDRG